jgi:hypothetical protein
MAFFWTDFTAGIACSGQKKFHFYVLKGTNTKVSFQHIFTFWIRYYVVGAYVYQYRRGAGSRAPKGIFKILG